MVRSRSAVSNAQAADRVIDAEQVLEFERDQVGRTNQQQIIGDDLRIDVAGRDAVSPIPVARLLALVVVKLLDSVSALASGAAPSAAASAARMSCGVSGRER